jgi:hypothetical protein
LGSGRPSARLAITATDDTLVIHGEVHAGDRVFAPADARNPYDNEHPDTMAAGVQLHLREGGTSSAWMLVPERESERVRVRAVMSAGRPAPMATWRPAGAGWEFRIELPVSRESEVPLALDVIINETVAGRERRRGQLVLSGARGEFVYLRGDRQGDEHLIPLVIVP